MWIIRDVRSANGVKCQRCEVVVLALLGESPDGIPMDGTVVEKGPELGEGTGRGRHRRNPQRPACASHRSGLRGSLRQSGRPRPIPQAPGRCPNACRLGTARAQRPVNGDRVAHRGGEPETARATAMRSTASGRTVTPGPGIRSARCPPRGHRCPPTGSATTRRPG